MSSSYTLEPSWELLKIQIDLIGLELHIDISISNKVHANFDVELNLRPIIFRKTEERNPRPLNTEVFSQFCRKTIQYESHFVLRELSAMTC